MKKRAFHRLLVLGACGWLMAGPASASADYPSKPIRIIVPFATGGGTSNAARLIGEQLTVKLGQPVVIENRPGGNTVIGASIAATSAPDGYTLFFANSSFAINPGLMPKLPYDSDRDFTPVAPILVNNFIMLAHPSSGFHTLSDLIKNVKAKPQDFPYPSVGAAGIGRIANEIFNQKIGVELVNIPYKGTGQLATDLMGGQVKYAIEIPGVYIPHIKANKLRALAVTGKNRLPSLPDVPTFAEAGMPEFDIQSWYGLLAPAGTPPAIIDKLNKNIQEILNTQDIRQKLQMIEAEPMLGSPSDFGKLIKDETERFKKVVKDAKIAVE